MLKHIFPAGLAVALLMGGISACGPKKAPPPVKLKGDGSDLSFTQIATQAKASGGFTFDAYELSLPAAKSTSIVIALDGGKFDNKDPNNWLYAGKNVFFDPYNYRDTVVLLRQDFQMGIWTDSITPAEAKARIAAGGTIDLPLQEALKKAGK